MTCLGSGLSKVKTTMAAERRAELQTTGQLLGVDKTIIERVELDQNEGVVIASVHVHRCPPQPAATVRTVPAALPGL